MNVPSISEIAWRAGQAFDSCGIEYLVGGSVASSLQGHQRSTQDIDFVANLGPSKVDSLVIALGPDFDVDDVAPKEAMHARRSWNIFFAPTMLRIDIFHVGPTEYDVESLFRRVKHPIDESRAIYISAPEDTVLRKLMWFKAGGEQNSQQWRDVVDVLRVQGDALSKTYLDRWSSTLGIGSLLERARAATSS